MLLKAPGRPEKVEPVKVDGPAKEPVRRGVEVGIPAPGTAPVIAKDPPPLKTSKKTGPKFAELRKLPVVKFSAPPKIDKIGEPGALTKSMGRFVPTKGAFPPA